MLACLQCGRGVWSFPLSGARVERQPRRHISEVSSYKARFDAEEAMQDLAR